METALLFHLISTLLLGSALASEFVPQDFNCRAIEQPDDSLNPIPDFLKQGDLLFTISNLTGFDDNSDGKELVEIHGNNVTLKMDMTAYCVEQYVSLKFKCEGSKSMLRRIAINRTESYNITIAPSYSTQVQEMTPNNTHLKLDKNIEITWNDCKDGNGFKVTDYSPSVVLETNGGGHFRWEASGNRDALYVNKLIDFEKTRSFTLKLQLSYEDLRATTTTEIFVNVIDIDDNNPTFNLSGVDARYLMDIMEGNSTPINTPLTSKPPILAYDPDFGINQTLEYSITEQPVPGLFKIDINTGSISISKELDRETTASYRIIIQAVQTDNPTRLAKAIVMVTVLDADDNLPEFKPTTVTAEVTEHSVSGTLIRMLSVFDPDEGDNSNFTCVLFKTSLPVLVTTVTGGCDVTVKDSLSFDREAFPNGEIIFQIGARATLRDVFGPDNATVTIKLQDINDNSPNFTETRYSFTLNNVVPGAVIGLVNASDPDAGGNGQVTYSFLVPVFENCIGGTSNTLPFYIDSASGEVYRNDTTPLCQAYRTMVEACDNPTHISTRRCSIVPLTVSANSTDGVRNISQEMKVSENVPIGSYIDSLECRGNGFKYTIPQGTNSFSVNTIGFVITATSLDREAKATYVLDKIEVRNAEDQVVCHINVTIDVTDVNDNAPKFTNDTYTFNLPENPADGQSIGYVSAKDDDEGKNGIIEYHLYNQGDSSFMMNVSTGEISIKSVAKVTPCDVITLNVLARDQGQPRMESFTQAFIICDSTMTSVPVSTPLNKEEVESTKTTLESELSSILNMTVAISGINNIDDSPAEKTQILLTAADPTIQQSTLLRSVMENYEAIRSLFYTSQEVVRDSDTSDSKFGAPEIALIAMGVVIIIGTVVAIVIINRQFNSHKRYKQLYESLTKNSSLYESQEIKVKMDDETSDYNGSVRSQELESNNSTRFPDSTAPAVNPGYVQDDHTYLKESHTDDITVIPTDSTTNNTVKEVIESLERLSDRLEQEGDDTVITYLGTEGTDTGDDVPLVDNINETDHTYENINTPTTMYGDSTDTTGGGYVNGSPVLYANVAMNNDNEAEYNNGDDDDDVPAVSNKARNSLEMTPRSDGASLNIMNVEAEINHTDQSSADEDNDIGALDDDEPNPDYDVKQVRFSGEVLDADDNVLQPLKPAKDVPDGDGADAIEDEQKEESQDRVLSSEGQVEPGWMEEEIQSPVNTVVESETGEEFYFCEDALTHL